VTEVIGEYDDIVFVSGMPTRNGFLVGRAGARWTMIENVDGRTTNAREIVVPEWIAGEEIAERRWSKSGERLFVKLGEDWGVIDLRTPDASINISREFSMRFENIAIVNDSGDKLYVLENSNIRVLDLRDRSISDVKVSGVAEISGGGEIVGYMRVLDDVWEIGAYRDGESAGKALVNPDDAGVRVQAWRYFGEDVVAVVYDGELVVMRGEIYGKMREIVRIGIGEVGAISVSPSGRFLVAGGQVVDVNGEEVFEAAAGKWLDDFMMYSVVEGKLTVWDFNGGNERGVGEAGEQEVMISRGDRWIYFVDEIGEKVMREKL